MLVLYLLFYECIKNDNNKNEIVEKIVNKLSDYSEMKSHARHLSTEECKSFGLRIMDLEDDNILQDLVLTIHHAYMHTFSKSAAIKIVENHKGVATIHQVQLIKK